jgi:uncharacterized protein YecE (DUF72 family)
MLLNVHKCAIIRTFYYKNYLNILEINRTFYYKNYHNILEI